jgi:hypothetical protein
MNYGVLFALEKRLLDPTLQQNRAALDRDFFEFGCSGKAWDRQVTIDALTTEPLSGGVETSDFQAHELSEDVVLVTYKTSRQDQTAIRSSVWRKRESNWKLFFHQGTKSAVTGFDLAKQPAAERE